jgi:hypothetical protein
MNILFYIFSFLYYVSFVNITLYLMGAATITPVVVVPFVKE